MRVAALQTPLTILVALQVPKNGSNMTWDGFNVDPMRQLDMDSLRYSLAFIGYATSGLTYQHTPAYREARPSLTPQPP